MMNSGIRVTPDVLVSIPRSGWRTILLALSLGSLAVFWFVFGLIVLADLPAARGTSAAHRPLLLGLVGLFWLNGIIKLVILRRSMNPPLEIFKWGIAVQGVKTPWDEVEGCRWGYYAPDTLEVHMRRARIYIPIPRDRRTTVEAILRDLGKWRS